MDGSTGVSHFAHLCYAGGLEFLYSESGTVINFKLSG